MQAPGDTARPAATAIPLRHVEHCMGTVFSLAVAPPGVDTRVLDHVVARLHEIDATYSTYRSDSVISRIADGRLPLADAPAEVRDVLDACVRWQHDTDGWFSPLAGGRLDPSGYVKGWAIAEASAILTEAGSTSHTVNGGGDVVCVGRAAADRDWRIGIADPLRPGALLRTVQGSGPFAVATSGTAERGEHVLDPHTGRPSHGVVSVTVIARSIVVADVLATAAFAAGTGAADWLRARGDVEAIVVGTDGTVTEVTIDR